MAGLTITFVVDDHERSDLIAHAAREKVNLSDYIRVRLGMRALGTQAEAGAQSDQVMRAQLADHELRLQALEAAR